MSEQTNWKPRPPNSDLLAAVRKALTPYASAGETPAPQEPTHTFKVDSLMPLPPLAAVEQVEDFWREVERSYDIEPRAFFEQEYWPMGFTSDVAMAVHHMWKRDVKDRDGKTIIGKAQHERVEAENTRLRAALEALIRAVSVVVSFAQSWEPLSPGDIKEMKQANDAARAALKGDA